MFRTDADGDRRYQVVVNHEGRYSIWPANLDLPAGWRAVGSPARRDECLAHIGTVWTETRLASARRPVDARGG